MRLLKEKYEGLPEVDRLSEALKTALKTILLKPNIQKALQNNDFDIIYDALHPNLASQFTQLMNSLDIDPLNYLSYIPVRFLANTSIKSIDIPDHITHIDDSAFFHCEGLTSITIPDNVVSIRARAFFGCTGLTSVTIGSNVADIREQAFYGCTSLADITIPDSVTNIGGYAFSHCSRLASIIIPGSVTAIGYSAFSDCNKLRDIRYAGTISQWSKIHFGDKWNKDSAIKTIHCTDGNITL